MENEQTKPARVDPVVMRLEAMRDIKDDWDSYGAIAPREQAIERAIVFAREMLTGNVACCPTVNGNVLFEGNGGTSI